MVRALLKIAIGVTVTVLLASCGTTTTYKGVMEEKNADGSIKHTEAEAVTVTIPSSKKIKLERIDVQ